MMIFCKKILVIKFVFFSLFFFSFKHAEIGQKIWKNECGEKIEGLTCWNRGEAFASMGIGHFIWYPKGEKGPFYETFPDLVLHLENRGIQVPGWLKSFCPWNSKEEFDRALDTVQMNQLRALLRETIRQQAEFIIGRFEKSSLGQHPQAKRLLKVSGGAFALIDYLNFKGEGTSELERYQGVGWGLKQVLDRMGSGGAPLEEFVLTAKKVLCNRVALAPPERGEERWLMGWKNRLEGYLK